MGQRDPRVDAYIASSAPFAQAILRHLREVVHKHCPEAVEEMKWSRPHFTYKGMLCGMSAFKEHAAFGFWSPLLRDTEKSHEAMGGFGRLKTVGDLPKDAVLGKLIKQAMKLNDEGIKPTKAPRPKRPPVVTPPDLAAALRKNKPAAATYAGFAESCKREYVEWITDAKRPETRAKRLERTVAQLAEGKRRNWKYENC
jgi:uncharacterized protein YdeI (YjbR/CyaY-like superfamily)